MEDVSRDGSEPADVRWHSTEDPTLPNFVRVVNIDFPPGWQTEKVAQTLVGWTVANLEALADLVGEVEDTLSRYSLPGLEIRVPGFGTVRKTKDGGEYRFFPE